jgi:MoxR-like ATPase
MNGEDDRASFDHAQEQLAGLREALGKSIVGHDALLRDLITALFAGGHILIEGLPGLGKTRLTQCLAAALGLQMNRIQCTPDLMPGDISGSETLQHTSKRQELVFRPGPVFANLVLVDEINRASPKTQSALLEAMQEQQVTYLGKTHPLPQPFWVLATQNPIELEGTYPLPEAQLDRFLFKLDISMPDASALSEILDLTLQNGSPSLPAVHLRGNDIEQLMATAKKVVVARAVRESAVRLILATQPSDAGPSGTAGKYLRYGASPRGLQALVRSAQVHALQSGRAHVATEDLAAVALPALRHRVLLTVDAEIQGHNSDAILQEIIEQWLSSLD